MRNSETQESELGGLQNQLSYKALPLPVPPPSVRFYRFGDGGVLHLNGSSKIWVLNALSALIWCLLDEVANREILADRVAHIFRINKEKALLDIKVALGAFDREGLFSRIPLVEVQDQIDNWDVTATGPRLFEPKNWTLRRFFRVANHVFEFCCQHGKLGQEFTGHMAHLALNSETPCDSRLAVVPGKGGANTWDIYVDDQGFREGLPENQVLPHLATLFFVRACETLKENLLFHAAVLEKNDTTVMFPGEAGSGKTTLAAVLMKHGYRFFSDEIAVLNAKTLCISPLPLPMSIKQGAVGPLSGYYPGLAQHPVHLRADGKMVRYVSPSPSNLPESLDVSTPVHSVVFPKYREGAATNLTSLDKMDALQRLARTGSSNRYLTDQDVAAIISLVEKSSSYELIYAEFSDAIALLEKHVFACSPSPRWATTSCRKIRRLFPSPSTTSD